MTRRVVLIGVGPGDPDKVTAEAVRAMNEVDFFVVTEKRRPAPPRTMIAIAVQSKQSGSGAIRRSRPAR